MAASSPDLVAVWEVQLPDGVHLIQAGHKTLSVQAIRERKNPIKMQSWADATTVATI